LMVKIESEINKLVKEHDEKKNSLWFTYQ
jgi:hypothetical protein